MDDKSMRAMLERHWAASDAGDFETEHDIYREDALLHYPQSGEKIRGRRNIQESRFLQPNVSRCSGSPAAAISGSANFCWPMTGPHLSR